MNARRTPRERRVTSPENSCIECGKGAHNHRCGCCSLPLCSMHNEVQGGFCSGFTGVHDVPGCILWGETFVAYTAAMDADEIDVCVTQTGDDQPDIWHIVDDDANPLCPGEPIGETEPTTLRDVGERAARLCTDCEERAVEIVAERDGGDE
ncbi:hypothetical protein [Halostella sp. PRR32]|uniref:hypothetical protein n=1 Tax=Halostella sp. PRR32 TaxID=3098147 RepID=UPI002B1D95DB|nr:hypothetical protein [Halostella sp. PRR32]